MPHFFARGTTIPKKKLFPGLWREGALQHAPAQDRRAGARGRERGPAAQHSGEDIPLPSQRTVLPRWSRAITKAIQVDHVQAVGDPVYPAFSLFQGDAAKISVPCPVSGQFVQALRQRRVDLKQRGHEFTGEIFFIRACEKHPVPQRQFFQNVCLRQWTGESAALCHKENDELLQAVQTAIAAKNMQREQTGATFQRCHEFLWGNAAFLPVFLPWTILQYEISPPHQDSQNQPPKFSIRMLFLDIFQGEYDRCPAGCTPEPGPCRLCSTSVTKNKSTVCSGLKKKG